MLGQLGLVESITTRHTDDWIAPTYQRRRLPIDRMFLSPTLSITAGGYAPFGLVPLDHCLLWTHISFDNALDYVMPPLVPPAARQLKTSDPTCVVKLLEFYEQHVRLHNLHLEAFKIQEKLLTQPMTPQLQ